MFFLLVWMWWEEGGRTYEVSYRIEKFISKKVWDKGSRWKMLGNINGYSVDLVKLKVSARSPRRTKSYNE